MVLGESKRKKAKTKKAKEQPKKGGFGFGTIGAQDLARALLDDPSLSSLADGDALTWNAAAKKFVAGPGGGGFVDGRVLDWYMAGTGIANGSEVEPPTQNMTLYANDGTTVVDDVNIGSLSASRTVISDEYTVNDNGSVQLWFTKAGLYVVQCRGNAAAAGVGIQVAYSAGNGYHSTTFTGQTMGAAGAIPPLGSLLLPVGEADLANPSGPLSSGATLSATVFNASGAPQDLSVELFVMRVT